jgi:AraC-like DNA-binding protein
MCYSIHYQDLKGHMNHAADGRSDAQLQHARWGRFAERTWALPHLRVFDFNADFNEPFRISYRDTLMPRVMNLCLAIDGEIEVAFSKLRAGLQTAHHHGMYIAEPNYDVLTRRVHVVHIEIDQPYFFDLLSDAEPWAVKLKDRIARQETVMSGIGHLDLSMQRTLFDILNSSLHGCLQNLLIEAKVLELLARQLQQFAQQGRQVRKPQERDLFVAIRDYLDQSFDKEHSLEALSRQFGINQFKLKKGFRETFQTSVFGYLFDKRMDYARQLLLDQDMQVCEVARKIGYKNPNHFSTAFKNKYGLNPTRLKK